MIISAPKPPWKGCGRTLESATRKALYDFQLLEGVSRLGIALSGGKDSLAMLFLLRAIIGHGTPNIDLVGFHVGGEFSCGASVSGSFLESFCEQLQVPLITQPMDPPKGKLECYSCSRRRRRLLFDMALAEGCSTIAFGHHRDDNAQTTLMNLLHKGEFAGLLPKITMHSYGITIIRPLIYVEEKAILTFAKQYEFHRITCRCPAGQRSVRRQSDQLIETLSSVFPNARANLAQAALTYGSRKAER